MIEAETGGQTVTTYQTSSGGCSPCCSLTWAIIFMIFFIGDLGGFINYLIHFNSAYLVTIIILGVASVLWLVLSLWFCKMWRASKGDTTTVIEVDTNIEVGGNVELAVEEPVIEVEVEAPEVELEVEAELEVEVEAPEVEVEVEVEAPEVEIEVGADVEVE